MGSTWTSPLECLHCSLQVSRNILKTYGRNFSHPLQDLRDILCRSPDLRWNIESRSRLHKSPVLSETPKESSQSRVSVDRLDTRTDQDEVSKSPRRDPLPLGAAQYILGELWFRYTAFSIFPICAHVLIESCRPEGVGNLSITRRWSCSSSGIPVSPSWWTMAGMHIRSL